MKYSLKIHCSDAKYYSPMQWRVRGEAFNPGHGLPTIANVDRWVTDFEQSRIDGANKHLGFATVVLAEVVERGSGRIVCTWRRRSVRPNEPLFQVIYASRQCA